MNALDEFFSNRFDVLYKPIFDSLSDGLYIVDTERKIYYWNKQAEDITGFRAEEVVDT